MVRAKQVPKYQQVLEILSVGIYSGKFEPGQNVPSEAALVRQFRTSRITIGRALRELTQRGLNQFLRRRRNHVE